jgi:hypothetical protein
MFELEGLSVTIVEQKNDNSKTFELPSAGDPAFFLIKLFFESAHTSGNISSMQK